VVELGIFKCNHGGDLGSYLTLDEVHWTSRCGEVGSEVCLCQVESMGELP